MTPQQQFRIIADHDLDGLVSAFLLTKAIPNVKEVVFTNPRRIEQCQESITPKDILCDLPLPRVKFHMWFDHHRAPDKLEKNMFFEKTDSCAELIFNKYPVALKKYKALVKEVSRLDSGRFTLSDFEKPTPLGKISMSLNTGFRERDDIFKQYLLDLLGRLTPDEIAKLPVVENQVKSYQAYFNKTIDKLGLEFHKRGKSTFMVYDFRQNPDIRLSSSFITYLKLKHVKNDYMATIAVDKKGNTNIQISENQYSTKKRKADLRLVATMFRGGGYLTRMGFYCKEDELDDKLDAVMTKIGEINCV